MRVERHVIIMAQSAVDEQQAGRKICRLFCEIPRCMVAHLYVGPPGCRRGTALLYKDRSKSREGIPTRYFYHHMLWQKLAWGSKTPINLNRLFLAGSTKLIICTVLKPDIKRSAACSLGMIQAEPIFRGRDSDPRTGIHGMIAFGGGGRRGE